MPQQLNRAWLIDQLRFYRRQLDLRRYHRAAQEAHDMIGLVLDYGMGWPDCVPMVALFVKEADAMLNGSRFIR